MKRKLALIAAALVATSTAALAHPFTFAGRWSSNWGDMNMAQDGAKLSGTYTHNDGRIVATVKGRVAEGLWFQSSSAERCAKPLDGSFYYGRMRFVGSGRSFKGVWSYCDANVGSGGSWTGTRK